LFDLLTEAVELIGPSELEKRQLIAIENIIISYDF
jgi:hypothetical protein